MSSRSIFITGASGFLGSGLLAKMVADNYTIMASRRFETNDWRCKEFSEHIKWVNADDPNFIQEVTDFNPDIIVHSAWSGVTAAERENWNLQLTNFKLLGDLITIAQKANVQKFIVLGSQAEYGKVEGKIDEAIPDNPGNAYAACKIAAKQLLKAFCEQNGITWYWLRVFSVFGPKESSNWFIPSIILNQLNKVDIDLTPGEQKYDYLYIEDFAAMIQRLLSSENSVSGIYNICSGKPVALKGLAEGIKDAVGSGAKLNFGALPYRAGQPMLIEGDNTKFNSTFGATQLTNLGEAIKNTVAYYRATLPNS